MALDDFVSGQASLTHLLRVPVDMIKIDQSFIANLWPEGRSLAIVQGLIDIGRNLGIRVVAKGIETELQANQLWTMGCAFGQGYDFSIPVDRNAMRDLIRRHGTEVMGSIPLMSRNGSTRMTVMPARARRRIRLHQ